MAAATPHADRPPVWRLLQQMPHVSLQFHDAGPRGRTLHSKAIVSLRGDLSRVERRDTLLHELLHVHRGPVPRGLKPAEEERVRRMTALYLLPCIDAIADALAWALSLPEAAEELGVSDLVLRKRLRHLCAHEREVLRRRLADHEDCAT